MRNSPAGWDGARVNSAEDEKEMRENLNPPEGWAKKAFALLEEKKAKERENLVKQVLENRPNLTREEVEKDLDAFGW
jgi:hypothetical protein